MGGVGAREKRTQRGPNVFRDRREQLVASALGLFEPERQGRMKGLKTLAAVLLASGVLVEAHIKDPMLTVLHAPVLADGLTQ